MNEPRPELEKLPADARRDRIVAAALAVFAEHGYAATRLGDIARRAGVSMSTLLLHFPSKEEIFRDVVRSTVIATLSSAERNAPPASVPATDAVRSMARLYWATMERPELIAILRLTLSELPRFPELAVFHATEALERFVRLLERIIQAGIARGELKPIDAKASARTIQATLAAHAFWFAHPEIYGGIIGSDRERAATATIETLVQTLGPVASEPP